MAKSKQYRRLSLDDKRTTISEAGEQASPFILFQRVHFNIVKRDKVIRLSGNFSYFSAIAKL